ncbi:hypothetical protein D3C76_352500 [compost metagenome]
MRLHHALGKAGGAAGVHDAGEVFTAAPGVFDRRGLGNQLLETQHAHRHFALAGIDKPWHMAGTDADLLGQWCKVFVDDKDAGTAIVQRIDDLRHAPADVHRVEHPAAPPHAHDVLQIAVGVERQHADPIAGRHAQTLQGTRQASDAITKLAIGPTAITENRRELNRVLLQRALQALGHVHGIWPFQGVKTPLARNTRRSPTFNRQLALMKVPPLLSTCTCASSQSPSRTGPR